MTRHDATPNETIRHDDTTSLDRNDPPADPPAEPSVCVHCGAHFVDEELLALHRGLEHGDALSDAEQEAYANAVASEREAVRLFRLKALVVLLLLYFGFIYVYAFVL